MEYSMNSDLWLNIVVINDEVEVEDDGRLKITFWKNNSIGNTYCPVPVGNCSAVAIELR